MAFQAIAGPGLVLCGAMLYGFDATLATGTTECNINVSPSS